MGQSKQVHPFSPEEVDQAKDWSIPDYVIEAVNRLLAREYTPSFARTGVYLYQDEVISTALEIANEWGHLDVDRNTLFDNNFLDFEQLYRKQGWKVEYFKPVYNETGHAYWTFMKNSK